MILDECVFNYIIKNSLSLTSKGLNFEFIQDWAQNVSIIL